MARCFKIFYLFLFLFMEHLLFAGVPLWQRVDYTLTSTFIGEIQINNYKSLYTNSIPEVVAGDYIGAFVDGECRMIAEIFAYQGGLYVSGIIHNGEMDAYMVNPFETTDSVIEFKLWDSSSDTEYSLLGTTRFNNELKIGSFLNFFPVGKPNTNNDLQTFSYLGGQLYPEFSSDIQKYDCIVSPGVLVENNYIINAVDRRAKIEIVYAQKIYDYSTVRVIAESGDIKEYLIRFTDSMCSFPALEVQSPYVCNYDKAPKLTVISPVKDQIRWYSDTASLNYVAVGNSYTPVSIDQKIWVSEFFVCEGKKQEVKINITSVPLIQISGAKNVCENETAPVLSAEAVNGSIQWFEELPVLPVAAMNTAEGTTYQKFENLPGLKTVWAVHVYNGCQGTPVSISYRVDSMPAFAKISVVDAIFQNDPPVPVTIDIPQGVLSASALNNGYFDPSLVAPGIYTISCSVTNGMCTSVSSKQIIVKEIVIGIDYTAINKVLYSVDSALSKAEIGSAVGNYPMSSKDLLSDKYIEAIDVKISATTQETIDEEVILLKNALDVFNNSKIKDEITGLSFAEVSRNMKVGEFYIPEIIFEPVGVTPKIVQFKSDSPNVFTVDIQGKIVAVASGSGKLIVSYNQYSDFIIINVFDDIVPLNFDSFDSVIKIAQELLNSAEIGDSVNQFPEDKFSDLNDLVFTDLLIKDSITKQSTIDILTVELQIAIDDFLSTQIKDKVNGIRILSEDQQLFIGDTFTPEIELLPLGVTPRSVKWVILNESSVVSLNQTTGEVSALKDGKVEVSVFITVDEVVYSDVIEYTIINNNLNILYSELSTPNMITIYFSGSIDSVKQTVINDFLIMRNSGSIRISEVLFDESYDSVITIVLSAYINASETIVLNYTDNGNIISKSNSFVNSLNEQIVDNNIPISNVVSEKTNDIVISANKSGISIKADEKIKIIQLYSITGMLVEKIQCSSKDVYIKNKTYSGIFIISVDTESSNKTKKIILN